MPGKSVARQAQEAAERDLGAGTKGQYHPSFPRLTHDYALLGATNTEIAELLGISESTFHSLLIEYPQLQRALRKARVNANIRVVKSQYHAARGYSHRHTKHLVVKGKVQAIETVKHYPPSTNAAALLLYNRDPSRWRSTVTTDHRLVGSNGQAVDMLQVAQRLAFVLSAGVQAAGDGAKLIEAEAEADEEA